MDKARFLPVEDSELKYPFKMKPRRHQLDCWNISRAKKAFALLMDMGTGKTKVLIDTAAWLYDQGEIDSLIVFAPKGVYRNWQDEEIPKHMPDHVKYRLAAWASSPTAEDKAAISLLEQRDSARVLRILLVNVEALSTKRAFEYVEKFMLGCKPLLAIDESTVIKHGESKRTKAVIWLGKYAPYRRIMSGEPAANSPFDLYAQFDFLDPFMLGYSSFYSFRNHFGKVVGKQQVNEVERVKGWRGMTSDELRAAGLDPDVVNAVRRGVGKSYTAVLEYRNMDELQKVISPHSFIVKKEDCLDLPPKTYGQRYVEMSPAQKEAYSAMKASCMVEVEGLLRRLQDQSASAAPAKVTRNPPLILPAKPGLRSASPEDAFAYFRASVEAAGGQGSLFEAAAPDVCDCWEGIKDRPLSPTCPLCGAPMPSGGKFSTASIVITQLLRLHQIVCGFVKTDAGEEIDLGDTNPRIEELLSILEGHGGKAIVWANYRRSIGQIRDALAKEYGPEAVATYYGGTKDKDRRAAIKNFQDPKSPLRWLVANRSAAYGLTLTAADLMVYFSNDYDREVRGQSEDRAHRIGQDKKVLYLDLICRGTVDEKIIRALRDKKDLSQMVTPSNWRTFFD
jgi:SNF2 family DNA or RNA helicase